MFELKTISRHAGTVLIGQLAVMAFGVKGGVKAGEKFEDLAKEFSNDMKRSKGGDWGWMKRSDFKKEFSDPAFDLKKGETSKLILLPEGAFVLFADELPELYRTVTSQYQRDARRNARHRAKSEPVPRAVSLAGSVVKRRPRRKAG